MVLIRECDDSGRVISPTNSVERDQLKRDCLRHATRLNGLIDWGAYELGLHGHNLFSDLSSDSDNSDGSGSDSDCVFLYATLEMDPKGEICQVICPYNPSSSNSEGKVFPLTYFGDFEIEQFTEEVRREYSLYTDKPDIDFFRSKLDISAPGKEEDVVVLSCDVDERVCDQELVGALDESFLMYMAVLEEFGVTIPFTAFEMDVLKFMNVASSQLQVWNLRLASSSIFMEQKTLVKEHGSPLASIRVRSFFLRMPQILRKNGETRLQGYKERRDVPLLQHWWKENRSFLFVGLMHL